MPLGEVTGVSLRVRTNTFHLGALLVRRPVAALIGVVVSGAFAASGMVLSLTESRMYVSVMFALFTFMASLLTVHSTGTQRTLNCRSILACPPENMSDEAFWVPEPKT